MTNIFKRIGGMLRSLKKKNNFTILSNTIIRSKTASDAAIGCLWRLLSLAPTWRYTFEGFVSQGKDRKTAVRNQLNELKHLHYFDEVQLKRKNGRFGGKAVIVNDEPMPKEVLEQIKKMIREKSYDDTKIETDRKKSCPFALCSLMYASLHHIRMPKSAFYHRIMRFSSSYLSAKNSIITLYFIDFLPII